jgi:hypothetical protein
MDFLDLVEKGWQGYSAISETKKPANYEAQLKEAIDLLSNARGLPAHRREFLIREAMTTSDFPLLFGDVLDRQVLASYKAVDPVWRAIVRPGTVRRIYPEIGAKRFGITGGDQTLARVGEKGEYLASGRTEKKYDIYVYKYGRQFDISFEALINDDLNALKDTPERFARAAVRTEHRLATGGYVHDVGTHAAGNLYDNATAGEINCVAALLTIANLEAAIQAMKAFRDANGEPIMNAPKYLVVPDSLEFTARQILTSAMKMWVEGTGATPTVWPMTNVLPQAGLTLIVDPYLTVLDGTAANGLTAWYLFADPRDIAALEFDYLEGHDRPEICMKASDKVSIGGGAISPFEGDFATDNIFYRVRDICGCNKLDWRATYMGGHTA